MTSKTRKFSSRVREICISYLLCIGIILALNSDWEWNEHNGETIADKKRRRAAKGEGEEGRARVLKVDRTERPATGAGQQADKKKKWK